VSKKWEGEIDAILKEVESAYKKYQSESVFLSETQKQKSEEDIMNKEKQASDLKKKYFGNEGELFKKRQSLMAPIQDEIYTAVKEICEQRGYQLVLDRASGGNIIFASPKIDISDEVLQKLGYSY
jgi:outer membrane protein